MQIRFSLHDHEEATHKDLVWEFDKEATLRQMKDSISAEWKVQQNTLEFFLPNGLSTNEFDLDSQLEQVGLLHLNRVIVKHNMLTNWQVYLDLIKKIRNLTSSGNTEARQKIFLLAQPNLSLLDSSDFFEVHPSLQLKRIEIDTELSFIVHNTEKYLKRSVLSYFENRFPHRHVVIKDKPKDSAGIHLGVFVFIDNTPLYYAKTMGNIPPPEEEMDFLKGPKIDLIEIFVYLLLKLTGIGSTDVHIIRDVNRCNLVFIATKIIENFYTASGVSVEQILDTTNPSRTKNIVIDDTMKRQLRILSSLLCLCDLRRNRGYYGVVGSESVGDERSQVKETPTRKRKLAIVDFGINIRLIDDEPLVLNSTDDVPFLKTFFEEWDLLNNMYKAKEAMMIDPVVSQTKSVNQVTFDRYFKRLEKALTNFFQ